MEMGAYHDVVRAAVSLETVWGAKEETDRLARKDQSGYPYEHLLIVGLMIPADFRYVLITPEMEKAQVSNSHNHKAWVWPGQLFTSSTSIVKKVSLIRQPEWCPNC